MPPPGLRVGSRGTYPNPTLAVTAPSSEDASMRSGDLTAEVAANRRRHVKLTSGGRLLPGYSRAGLRTVHRAGVALSARQCVGFCPVHV